MKDIVENRRRLPLGKKVKIAFLAVEENGWLWTFSMGVYYLCSAIAEKAFGLADRHRRDKGLPGLNSAAMNKLIWESWDWSAAGEEWTPSPEWKTSVIRKILAPNVPEGAVVVEIGPGGGRWTEELQKRAARLTGIDISETCVEECRKRFAHCENVEFVVGSGRDLKAAGDASADAIWSFDVFVHINKTELAPYAAEFFRVLKPGGTGILHHGTVGGQRGGWRSDVTSQDMRSLLTGAGLEVVDQFQTWEDGGAEHEAGLYDDAITIFRKPA